MSVSAWAKYYRYLLIGGTRLGGMGVVAMVGGSGRREEVIKATRFPNRFSATQRKCFYLSIVVFVLCSHFRPGELSTNCLLLRARGLFFSDTYLTTPVKTMVRCPSFIVQPIYDLVRAACGFLDFCPSTCFRTAQTSNPHGLPHVGPSFMLPKVGLI